MRVRTCYIYFLEYYINNLFSLSGDGVEMFLGAPAISDGRGSTIAGQVVVTLRDWRVQFGNIVLVVFDTTKSNTGKHAGAIVHLQFLLNKAVLWVACRHHMAEVILTHIFTGLDIETSTSPEVTLFQRFRNVFPELDRTPQNLNFLPIDEPVLITKLPEL